MTCLQWLYHNLNISYNIKFKTYMEKKKKRLTLIEVKREKYKFTKENKSY